MKFFSKPLILFAVAFIAVATPVFAAHADVSINEVAWMGTKNSQYEEWIELYNNGTDDVSLAGWKILKGDGGTTLFTLTKTIAAGHYYLVCRTTTSVPTPLGGTCDENGSFGGSGLSNSGEHLQLQDTTGNTVDDLPFSNGWPAGDTTSKETMQRTTSDTWVTAAPTPGTINANSADAGTPTSSSGSTSNSGDTDSSAGTTTTQTSGLDDTTASSDSGSVSVVSNTSQNNTEQVVKVVPDPTYTARINVPDFDTAGVAVPMTAIVEENGKRDMASGKFEWSMGDGAQYVYDTNTPVNHIYYYPGTYTVVLTYFSSSLKSQPDSIHRKVIAIVPSSVAITGLTDDNGVVLQNNSTNEIDLAGWILSSNGSNFTFPEYTIISKGQSLSVSSKTLGFTIAQNSQVQLLNPSSVMISKYP